MANVTQSGKPFSDSVNLGSNPSPPATANADVSGVCRTPSASEKSEIPEQTAHTGRTETGTAALHAEAIGHGYKDETCSKCGALFLAHIHFVRCETRPCPMVSTKDPRTILERFADAARSPAPPFA